MTIATLPPSLHLRTLRQLLDKMRRHHNTAYGIPTREELAHASESLSALELYIKPTSGGDDHGA